MATVKRIFDRIGYLNPELSCVSSLGYYKGSAFDASEYLDKELEEALPTGSLACNILRSTEVGKFSQKQLWVIAYELLKNEEWCKGLDAEDARRAQAQKQKEEAHKAKLAANKAASADGLAAVKDAGKLLKDYYAWLKKSSYKREFYSKKYSQASVEEFLKNN